MAATNKNFIDLFSTLFETFSYNNGQYGKLCAHVLLGQVLKHIKIYFGPIYIDSRISLFLMQPSGTGKSTGWPFVKNVGELAQLRMDDIDVATDAALVGTDETEEVVDPDTKVKTVIHNVVKGKLANADILHYDEGQLLINRDQHATSTLGFFQKALNPIDSGTNKIVKYMAHQEIVIEPTCSLLITSHEIENLLDTILNTGFFQRIVLYPRYITINDRIENDILRGNRFGKRSFSEVDIETVAAKLAETAKVNEKFEVDVHPNVYPIVRQYINDFYKLIAPLNDRVRETMASFAPRYENLMYIFAVHYCCANFKKQVDVADIKDAGNLAYTIFKDVLMWVEENTVTARMPSRDQIYLNQAVAIYNVMQKDENGFVSYITILNVLEEKWRVSKSSVSRRLEKFKGYGKMKMYESNNVKKIKFEL